MTEPVRLVTNIETAEAKASHRGLKDQVVRDHTQMQAASKATDRGIFQVGQTAGKMASVTTAGLSAVSAGFAAATASAQSATTAIASMTASVVAGFSSGGIAGLAIASLAAGIGWIIGETNRAEDAARKAGNAYADWLKRVQDGTRKAIEDTRDLIQEGKVAAGVILGIYGSEDEGRIAQRLKEVRAEIEALEQGRPGAQLLRKNPEAALTALRDEQRELERKQRGLANLRELDDAGDVLKRVRALEGERSILEELLALEDQLMRAREKRVLDQQEFSGTRDIDEALDIVAEARRTAIAQERLKDPLVGLRQQLATAEATLGGAASNEISIVNQILETKRQIQVIEESGSQTLGGQLRVLSLQLELLEQLLDRTRKINQANAQKADDQARRQADERARVEAEARDRINEAIRREIALTQAATDAQRAKLQILFSEQDLRRQGADEGLLGLRRDVLLAQLRAQAPNYARELIEGMAPTVSQGLTDMIMDGITNGFSSASDIAQNVMRALLASLIQQIISSGITQLMASIFSGGGSGGTFSSVASVVTSIAGGGAGSFTSSIGGSVAAASVPIPAPGGC